MAIEFDGCNISENKTGVRVPESAKVMFKDTDIVKNDIGVDVYISSLLADKLGLPENTPQSYVDEVEKLLKANADQSTSNKIKLLENSTLFKWLGHTSSLITIATALIAKFG
ncbi:hypothetical protein R8N45_08320 [Vibrio sp. 1403]|uniref:hypothetical protein n=1 Tax=Vibrio TaxID=662 RepID=UPI001A8E4A98|nr:MULTISPECIES: hypothetical protein [Vibrio]MBO0197780.1 hypothetical protein [Vibrio alginolyticus]MDW3078527.1 hypothetical protein [Vibrio sp. 1403]